MTLPLDEIMAARKKLGIPDNIIGDQKKYRDRKIVPKPEEPVVQLTQRMRAAALLAESKRHTKRAVVAHNTVQVVGKIAKRK